MRRPVRVLTAVAIASALIGLGCSGDDPSAAGDDPGTEQGSPDGGGADEPAATTDPEAGGEPVELGQRSETYSDPATWLCRPDLQDDACDVDLTATLVHADGATEVQPFEPAVDPGVDCFYAYPTISGDPGENSDLVPGDAELGIATNQAARFGEACAVYAPMYRQIPLGALASRLSGASGERSGALAGSPREIAYGDVREAFMHYLAEFNSGRPFVLIGHSQGASHLARLLREEIDTDDTLRQRLLSAMLLGTSVPTDGEESFENIPPCEDRTDTGCVVSYASFYAAEPPPADSLFGRVAGEGRALCTNPADPADPGPAPLQTYLPAGSATGGLEVDTPFVHYDGLLTGQCRSEGEFDWLEVTNTSAGAPAWPSDLGGRLTPQWGTHLMDVNFAIGDLVELVRSQSEAS